MKTFTFLLSSALFLIFTKPVQAVCPICTAAVAGGLGISRWLGIDDSVVGLWIGALVVSASLLLANIFEKKWPQLPAKRAMSLIMFALFFLPILWLIGVIGLPGNTLMGVDKILLGIGFGGLIFFLAVVLDTYLKKINDGKVIIYYQTVIIPVFLLSLASFIFYLITV